MRYTDQRLTSDQFAGVRDKLPHGQLPVARIDGVNISQSMAIARLVTMMCKHPELLCVRYLADKFDLAGRTNLERAQVDEAVDSLNDLVEARAEAVRAEDGERKAKFMTETVPLILVKY